ncbi:MAG: hypothetical protein HDS70_05560 [Bacteroidales bacterium]|nr:hypothetical protein [Bacteroidales bacterium]MBD5221821.1 hypothetical protein [Bacteroidales bacterium]
MKITKWIAAICATFVLCACSDLNDFPEDSIQLYQQYEVYIQDNSKAGFANFYVGGPEGQRFRLTGDAKVTVNDVKLLYAPSVTETSPEFNYSTYIDLGDRSATFRLFRSKNRTLTNSVDISDIPYITMGTNATTLSASENIPYTASAILQPQDQVEVSLAPAIGGTNVRIYKAVVSPISNSFRLHDVPAGRYFIRLDVVRQYPTTENDGSASGTIRVIRRKMTGEITVTE